jgi:hypothetical protein
MGLLVAFWGFSHLGDVVLLSLVGGGFALGFVLALWPWNGYVWLGLVLAGPVAAVIAFRIINPDPGCTYDCMAKAGWALLFFFRNAGMVGRASFGYAIRQAGRDSSQSEP